MASRVRSLAARVVFVLVAATLAAPVAARDIEVAPTGEAAVAQPMVVLTLGEGRTGASRTPPSRDDLSDLIGDLPAIAILDTGASGHVLSAATASRFDVEPETGARYVETGMSGDHAFKVSRPVSLEVTDFEPDDGDDDTRGKRRPHPSAFRLSAQRLLLHEAPADLTAALLSPGTIVDVVGMPLIRERVVEIVPHGEDEAVAVRLHASAAGLGVDTWITLDLVDFNRRNPRNRGPLPSLATNPLVPGVTVSLGATKIEGDWLLDTGAVCSMISTAAARRLGLVDADGKPVRRPDFTLPIGGVNGGSSNLPGFRLDRLALATSDGRTLAFPDPAVVVHDISTVDADGDKITLDGVFGMNLLLPSGSGMTMLGATEQLPGPFERVVIDVPGKRLGVRLR